jgi:hypothetical protein
LEFSATFSLLIPYTIKTYSKLAAFSEFQFSMIAHSQRHIFLMEEGTPSAPEKSALAYTVIRASLEVSFVERNYSALIIHCRA